MRSAQGRRTHCTCASAAGSRLSHSGNTLWSGRLSQTSLSPAPRTWRRCFWRRELPPTHPLRWVHLSSPWSAPDYAVSCLGATCIASLDKVGVCVCRMSCWRWCQAWQWRQQGHVGKAARVWRGRTRASPAWMKGTRVIRAPSQGTEPNPTLTVSSLPAARDEGCIPRHCRLR